MMIWVDWVLIGALLVSILLGVIRGFTREILGLLTWILALIVALIFGPSAVGMLAGHISVPSLRVAGAYALVFFGTLVAGAIVTSVMASLVRKSPLSGVDRMVGGGFGAIRGVFIAVMAVWLVGMTPARQDAWWKESLFVGKLEWLADGFEKVLPAGWASHLKPPVAKEGV